MRKFLFALALMLIMPTFVHAEVSAIDRGYSEKINSYSVNLALQDNNTLVTDEIIEYDFGNNEKHGVYRYIPTVFKDRNGNPRQTISEVTVRSKDGASVTRKVEPNISYTNIQIGDADRLVTGVQTYRISYKVNRVVSSSSNNDVFSWDAIGTGWETPIENVLISLTLTPKQSDALTTLNCVSGATDSTSNCRINIDKNIGQVAFTRLMPHEGVTLTVKFKPNTFTKPSPLEVLLWESHWYYWLPLVAFLGFFLLWFEKGRDPKGRGTIVPMYDPPKGLTPFESSILMDDMISKKSLPAAIISLAIGGYIKIHKKDVKVLFATRPDYELELLKPLPKDASAVEQKVIDLFFIGRDRVSLNDLGDSFADLNASLHQTAYREVTEKGYYVVNPTISRIIFFSTAVALLVIGILTAVYFLVTPLGYVCFILPGVIGLAFAIIMPVKTKTGAILKEDLMGLKMYIKTAEIDRIKFHNAPAKTPEKFEELLPYAIIFGLEKEWAEEFKDIYKNAPDWYDGNMATFSVVYLANDLNSFSNAAISAAISSSASSAGGVGGGGGGGGGGSW